MAGRALTPIGAICKWVLIPLALVACGFFLIGSRGRAGSSKTAASSKGSVADSGNNTSYASPDIDVHSTQALSAPEVEVTAKKARHRHHRANPVPNDDAKLAEHAQTPLSPRATGPERKPLDAGA